MAIKIVALILGFIGGVLSYPYYDKYVYELVALAGAIATGVLVYLLVEAGLRRLFREVNQD